MYKDTGKKILGLANTICIIGIVISCIGGLAVMASDEDMIIVGLLAAGLGSLGSWLGSLILAGFGELISNTTEIRNMLAAGQNPPAAPAQNPYGYNATPYAAPYGQENGQI